MPVTPFEMVAVKVTPEPKGEGLRELERVSVGAGRLIVSMKLFEVTAL